jgi:hypothetical protein
MTLCKLALKNVQVRPFPILHLRRTDRNGVRQHRDGREGHGPRRSGRPRGPADGGVGDPRPTSVGLPERGKHARPTMVRVRAVSGALRPTSIGLCAHVAVGNQGLVLAGSRSRRNSGLAFRISKSGSFRVVSRWAASTSPRRNRRYSGTRSRHYCAFQAGAPERAAPPDRTYHLPPGSGPRSRANWPRSSGSRRSSPLDRASVPDQAHRES